MAEPKAQNAMTESVRFRITPTIRKRWDSLLEDRKLSQQDAANALFGWIVEQEPMLQAMIFGQVPDSDMESIAKLVLKRLADKKKAK